jgi:methionyl-tRNA formyltransferase
MSGIKRVVVAGNNWIACEVLRFLLKQDVDILALPEGKDMVAWDQGWECPFALAARYLEKLNPRLAVKEGPVKDWEGDLRLWKPDLFLSCRVTKRLPKAILDIARVGSLNIHYGMLPRYGGIQPIPWAIWNEEKEVGVTWHKMAPELDLGSVVDQQGVPIGPKDTAHTMYVKANQVALVMFKRLWPEMEAAVAAAKPMNTRAQLYYDAKDYEELKKMADLMKRAMDFSSDYERFV